MNWDLIEPFYYLFGFWLFIFSPRFRAATLKRWQARKGLGLLATLLEIASATLCGVVIPYLVLEAFGILG